MKGVSPKNWDGAGRLVAGIIGKVSCQESINRLWIFPKPELMGHLWDCSGWSLTIIDLKQPHWITQLNEWKVALIASGSSCLYNHWWLALYYSQKGGLVVLKPRYLYPGSAPGRRTGIQRMCLRHPLLRIGCRRFPLSTGWMPPPYYSTSLMNRPLSGPWSNSKT